MKLDLNAFESEFKKNGKYFEGIDKSILLDYYNHALTDVWKVFKHYEIAKIY